MLKESVRGPHSHWGRLSISSPKTLLFPVVAIFLVVVFCALGFWQLQRADEKRTLQDEYDQRSKQAPLVLTPTVRPAQALQFFHVQASGTYEEEHQLLLDNRSHRSVPGYHVITPLRIAGSDTRVLVNRGWVPLGGDRAHLPNIDIPRGQVTVDGIAVVPHDGFRLGEPASLRRNGITVWQQLDLTRYAREAGMTLQPIVILLNPENSAGGYVREWARLDAGIAVHQGYAFQWFMLALSVVVFYLMWIWRARRKRNQENVV